MRTEQSNSGGVAGTLSAPVSARASAQAFRSRPLRKLMRFAREKPLGAIGGIIVIVLLIYGTFCPTDRAVRIRRG